MPSIYELKPAFQNMLRPIVGGLVRIGVTPNQVTILALVVSAGAGAAIACEPIQRWALLAVPMVLFVRMALNAIDGMMAREYEMATPLGAVLNEIGDVISDAFLYLPFAKVHGFDGFLVAVVVVLAGLSEMVGVVAVQIGASRRYDGPMGKSDRAFIFGLFGVLIGFGVDLAAWANWLLLAVAGLLVWTILNRAINGVQEVQN